MARAKTKGAEKSFVHDRIAELETAIAGVRAGRNASPRTARLLAGGIPRMAQKMAEEATEVVIEAVRGERSAVINKSVDLIYNLTVLWSELGITAADIWAEMYRRQELFVWDGGEVAEGGRGIITRRRRLAAKLSNAAR